MVEHLPTFTHDRVFDLAAGVMMRAAYPEMDWFPGEDIPIPERAAALQAVFDAVRKRGAMPAETAYRIAHSVEKQSPPWGEHPPEAEIAMAVFVSVVVALLPIADRQQAAFDRAAADLVRERRRGVFRKRRAARRAQRAERKAERPAKVREFIENRAANREAPRPAPVKTARAPRSAPADATRTHPKGAPKKGDKPKGPVGKGGKR